MSQLPNLGTVTKSQEQHSPIHVISADDHPCEYLQEYLNFFSSISPVLSSQFPSLNKRELRKITIFAYKKLVDPE